jgi:hypothetical protein
MPTDYDAPRVSASELPGADLSGEHLEIAVEPQHSDEFVCGSCFLVHHGRQLADAHAMVCHDCA